MRNAFRTMGLLAATLFCLLPIGAKALTISPPLVEHELNPGDTVLQAVQVYNEGNSPITVYPLLRNFVAGNTEGGEPNFLPPDADDFGLGLAQWVEMSAQPLTVAPGQKTSVPFALNIPANANPGGHYGAILFSTEPPSDRPGVGVSQQLGALIMIRVSGEVREAGAIAEFGFAEPKVWHNHLPIEMFMRFRNTGNTHLRPVGNVFITNMFGRQVASIKVNDPDYRAVLPNSIRKFTFGWRKDGVAEGDSGLKREWNNFAIGKHKATLVIYYGQGNSLVAAEKEFTVWPWRLMLLSLLGAAVLIALMAIRRKVVRRRLEAKLEREFAKRKGIRTEQEIRAEVEADIRRKVEKEFRKEAESAGRRAEPEAEALTELPEELKEDGPKAE